MGDVIAWSKLNKITKMVKNLPTSLATNFGEVKDSISGLTNNFNSWKAPWTSTRASKLDKLDKVDAIANDTHSVWNSIPSGTDSVAKQTTLNTVNSNVSTLVQNMGAVKSVQRINLDGVISFDRRDGFSYGVSGYYKDFTFSPVNLEKTVVFSTLGVMVNRDYNVDLGLCLTDNHTIRYYKNQSYDVIGDIYIVEFN